MGYMERAKQRKKEIDRVEGDEDGSMSWILTVMESVICKVVAHLRPDR